MLRIKSDQHKVKDRNELTSRAAGAYPYVRFVILLTPAPFSADTKNILIPDLLTPKNTKFKIFTPKHTKSHFFSHQT